MLVCLFLLITCKDMSQGMLNKKYVTTDTPIHCYYTVVLVIYKTLTLIVSLIKLTGVNDFLKLIFHSLNVTMYLL